MVMRILKSILVGLDRSSDNTPAMELGLHWAKQFEAQLVGIGLADEFGIEVAEAMLYREGYIESVHPHRLAAIEKDYKQVLEAYNARCAESGVVCTTLEETARSPARLLGEAQRHDMVVLDRVVSLEPGCEGGLGHALNLRVVKDSPRPVVIAPRTPSEMKNSRVVVAYDGSLQAARALYAAVASVLRAEGVKVHVVSVAPNREEAARAANQSIAFLRLHQIDALSNPIESSRPPAEVILEQNRLLDAGLVVMGAFGKPVLREFFLGSVTRSILKESPVPVFLFH
jgi:nucleotide-binding universal stress UspA family protein